MCRGVRRARRRGLRHRSEGHHIDPVIEIIRVDLHCHSSLSDGDHTPAHIAQQLAAIGVVWAALTDHNTLDGQEHFRAALEKRGLHFISGLEMDVRSPDGPLQLLAYGFDLQDQALIQVLRTLRQPWRSSARHWIGRARSLGERTPSSGAAQPSTNGDLSPHRPPGTPEAIRLIHEAGGRAFLAHPLATVLTVERLEKLLDWLQPLGLDGMEALHKPYSPSTQGELLEIAERRGLLVVAGSDFHGFHHSDGADPGVDMPLKYWNRFMASLTPGKEADHPNSHHDGFTFLRGHVGH
jgi:predicted metal-dependent phosphoesterase TrpH